MEATFPASVNVIESLTPAGTLSGMARAGSLDRRMPCCAGWLICSASATAAWASTLPCPNHGLQVPSGWLMLVKAPEANGATGETSHEVFESKGAAGVRGYAAIFKSFEAVRLRM